MRQARLKMPPNTFEEAWVQHDAAEKACLSFGRKNEVCANTAFSSTKTLR